MLQITLASSLFPDCFATVNVPIKGYQDPMFIYGIQRHFSETFQGESRDKLTNKEMTAQQREKCNFKSQFWYSKPEAVRRIKMHMFPFLSLSCTPFSRDRRAKNDSRLFSQFRGRISEPRKRRESFFFARKCETFKNGMSERCKSKSARDKLRETGKP